jgi:hypothetical protein
LGSENIAEITFAVTTESSKYSPEPSLLTVEAQPRIAMASKGIATMYLIVLFDFFMMILAPLKTEILKNKMVKLYQHHLVVRGNPST